MADPGHADHRRRRGDRHPQPPRVAELLEQGAGRASARRACHLRVGRRDPGGDDHRRRTRVLVRAPTCASTAPTPRARPTSACALAELYNPSILAVRELRQARARLGQRRRRRDRLRAGARLRPDHRRRVVVLPARLREHRPRPRRRRDGDGRRPGRRRPRRRDGDARRARSRAAGARLGPDQPRRRPTTSSSRPRPSCSPASPAGRRAPTRTSSGCSTAPPIPHLADQLDAEAAAQREQGHSADFIEGVIAFSEKRPPRFSGT